MECGRDGRVLEKVLIVEDEAHARTGLTELVASWGYRAEGAADGVEGLERVRQWSPGIVVTDLKMPRMDGMELLARIGELQQGVVVVMLTAQGSIESAVEAMRMGRTTIFRSRSTRCGCGRFCRMRGGSASRMWSWRRRGGSCATQAWWGRWWDRRRR